MSKTPDRYEDGMRKEYDFSEGVRGKYTKQFAKGCNIVVLDPDLAEEFKTSEAVNRALRAYLAKRRPEEGAAS